MDAGTIYVPLHLMINRASVMAWSNPESSQCRRRFRTPLPRLRRGNQALQARSDRLPHAVTISRLLLQRQAAAAAAVGIVAADLR